jgi:hypothetical protein
VHAVRAADLLQSLCSDLPAYTESAGVAAEALFKWAMSRCGSDRPPSMRSYPNAEVHVIRDLTARARAAVKKR